MDRFEQEFPSMEPEVQCVSPPPKVEMPGRPKRKTGVIVGILALVFLIAFNYFYQNYIQPIPVVEDNPPGQVSEGNDRTPENPAGTGDEEEDPIGSVEEEPVTSINLRLVGVHGRCWVRVSDNQQKIYEGIINQGEEKVFADLSNITLMFGNSGVQTFINEIDYGRLGSDQHVVTKTYVIEDNQVKEVEKEATS